MWDGQDGWEDEGGALPSTGREGQNQSASGAAEVEA